MLSYELWQNRYGGDRGVVGRPIRVDAHPATVIGVMPKDFSLSAPRSGMGLGDAGGSVASGMSTRTGSCCAVMPALARRKSSLLSDRGSPMPRTPNRSDSAASMARRAARPHGHGPHHALDVRHDARRGVHGAADRLRECGEPAADAHARAGARNWRCASPSAPAARRLVAQSVRAERAAEPGRDGIALALAQAGLRWQQALLRESEFTLLGCTSTSTPPSSRSHSAPRC